jgi:hypothetical protein
MKIMTEAEATTARTHARLEHTAKLRALLDQACGTKDWQGKHIKVYLSEIGLKDTDKLHNGTLYAAKTKGQITAYGTGKDETGAFRWFVPAIQAIPTAGQ